MAFSLAETKYAKWSLRVTSVHGESAPLPFIKSVEVSSFVYLFVYLFILIYRKQSTLLYPWGRGRAAEICSWWDSPKSMVDWFVNQIYLCCGHWWNDVLYYIHQVIYQFIAYKYTSVSFCMTAPLVNRNIWSVYFVWCPGFLPWEARTKNSFTPATTIFAEKVCPFGQINPNIVTLIGHWVLMLCPLILSW